jgi:hypothetical protein
MGTEGQTGMMKLIVAFRNFANAPKSILRKHDARVDWTNLAQHTGPAAGCCEHGNERGSTQHREFLHWLNELLVIRLHTHTHTHTHADTYFRF